MSRERIEELLALDATEGLAGAEREELERLLEDHPDLADAGFDRAAAAIHLALLGPEEPLPDTTRQRLRRAGERFVAEAAPAPAPGAPAAAAPRPAWSGWLAAAAALILALVGWWPRLSGPPPAPDAPPVAGQPPVAVPPSPADAPDALTLAWQATDDPAAAGAAGAVVWSPQQQAGFMRIRGLAANDPTVAQYQLWIFDKERDERYPVDGGVFDMPAGVEEAIVPIDARIAVAEPVLFAVTVERPGGVVVSARERIVLLAQAAA